MAQSGRLERRYADRAIQAEEVSWNDEKSNTYPYMMIALALAFVGFGVSVGLTA